MLDEKFNSVIILAAIVVFTLAMGYILLDLVVIPPVEGIR